MKWLTLGALLAALAVVAGAFAAHGLDGYFVRKYTDWEAKTVSGLSVPASWKYLQDFKTGARYQMYHALGMMAVGLLCLRRRSMSLELAGWLFLAGIVLFSGALYVLTVAGPHWLGITWGLVAPFGGTAFILGWVALAVGACPCGGASNIEHEPA